MVWTSSKIAKTGNISKNSGCIPCKCDYLIGIEKNRSLDLSGLTDEEIEIIECLVKSMREKNKKIERG